MKKRENGELYVQKKEDTETRVKARLRFKKKIQKDVFKFKSSAHAVLPLCIKSIL
jgi:hypothetical protein